MRLPIPQPIHKKFLTLFYESWKREVSSAVLLTLITLLLTYREKDAWHSARIALLANFILLVGWGIYHWSRLPYIVRNELLAQIPTPAEPAYSPLKIAELIRIYDDHTQYKADQIFSEHRGKPLQVIGVIRQVTESLTMILAIPGDKDSDPSYFVSAQFKENWREHIISLRKDDQVRIRGKIDSGNSSYIGLKDADFISTF